MVERQRLQYRIAELLTWFVYQVKGLNKPGWTDINHAAENIFIPLFREVYGYSHLKNLNAVQANFPNIDLGDESAGVAFQITSDSSSNKIKEVLKGFVSRKQYSKYTHLIHYILTEKKSSYPQATYDKIIQGAFQFDVDSDIIDYKDLLAKIETLDIEKLGRIEKILEANIDPSSGQSQSFVAGDVLTRQFQALIEERTNGFVGRDFIFQGIDQLLADEHFSSGYILIQGEPGIGKTALLGQLVKQRGYIHHFNIASQNIRSAKAFLQNVCAQLIVRYQLGYTALPDEATLRGGFLSQLLSEARAQSNENLVILIDALDEAEDVPVPSNRLFLPESLPRGVFFVITTREKHAYNLSADRRENIYLRDDDPQNLKDIQSYIQQFILDNVAQMDVRIAKWRLTREEFLAVLTDKSQGNFMYLVHVLRDIRDEKLVVSNIDSVYDLPNGLREYYIRHWECMRAQDPSRFRDYYEPVVCILGLIDKPLEMSQIVRWTNQKWPQLNPSTIRAVTHTWREFLNEDRNPQGEPLYHLYHASFRDFLVEEVGLIDYYKVVGHHILSIIGGIDAQSPQSAASEEQ